MFKELNKLAQVYGKQSHTYALESACRLRECLVDNFTDHSIHTSIFHADAMDQDALINNLGEYAVDIVIADIPYGNRSTWWLQDPSIINPVGQMLTNLLPALTRRAIVAIAADKRSKISHPFYERIERFQIGKRRVVLLSPVLDL